MNPIDEVLRIALDAWTLLVAGGIYFLLRVFNGFRWLSKRTWYRRLLPVLPEVLGVSASVACGLPAVEGKPLPIKIAAGLWCAYAAQKFQKVLGQSVLGDDRAIVAGLVPDDDKE